MAGRLLIWLGELPVAVVTRKAKRLRLGYTEEALAVYPAGTPVLSVNLPVTSGDYPNAQTTAFLDGLLPEGESRRAAAERFDLPASDTFGLLEAIGRDCAGALVVQPEDEPPPRRPTARKAEPVGEDDIGRLIANLHSAPLGMDVGVRISLAGIQEKLLLTRMPGGGWGRPVEGSASTHILKPSHPAFPDSVANEAFCMRLAHHLGLPVAEVDTTTVAGRDVLVVARFDRLIRDDGAIERLHQEDFCQALGVPPRQKYEGDGGPSLKRIAELLAALSGSDALETLLRTVTMNVVIGNDDAHAKNFALLHSPAGGLGPAPLYDLVSTQIYDGLDLRMAMSVDAAQRLDRITAGRLANEGASWGLLRTRAAEAVEAIIEAVPHALEKAVEDVANVPRQLVRNVERQLKRLRN